jgi:hypothetical protein
MPSPSVNHKQKQIPLSQYETSKAKQDKRKPILDIPGPVLLIITAPVIFFVILIVGYIIYIRRVAAH